MDSVHFLKVAMLQNIILFPDQPTHAYLIPTMGEIVCFCNYKAKAKQKTTVESSFSFLNHKIYLSLKIKVTVIIVTQFSTIVFYMIL